MLSQIGKMPKEIRDYYIMAMTEGKGIGAGDTEAIMKAFDHGQGAFGANEILEKARRNTSGAEGYQAEMSAAQTSAAEAIKEGTRKFIKEWDIWLSDLTATSKAQEVIATQLHDAVTRRNEEGSNFTGIPSLNKPHEAQRVYAKAMDQAKYGNIDPSAVDYSGEGAATTHIATDTGTIKIDARWIPTTTMKPSPSDPVKKEINK